MSNIIIYRYLQKDLEATQEDLLISFKKYELEKNKKGKQAIDTAIAVDLARSTFEENFIKYVDLTNRYLKCGGGTGLFEGIISRIEKSLAYLEEKKSLRLERLINARDKKLIAEKKGIYDSREYSICKENAREACKNYNDMKRHLNEVKKLFDLY